ncbi:sensor histidine kinase [Nocardioides dongkuii]|uniref:sensor histidine kinase n=1 Tax=Nocardioides dongkuii TaxID=2760089 RepID=UPI001FCFDAFC|nr:ATP-binding protein [Nocardioides dongkuii]
MSVRVRITATVAALVALTLAGAGLLVYAIETQRLEQQTADDVDQELDEFARLNGGGVDPVTGAGFASVQDLLELFMRRNVPDDDELLVGWVGDRVVNLSPREDPLVADPAFLAAAAPLVDEADTVRLETAGERLMITSQPVRRGGERGALLVVVRLEEDQSELLDTMRTYAIVAALSLLLVTVVAFWQSGRLLAPLRVLRETAEEIGETDLSRRIPTSGNDDITALTRTVNGMLDRLESAFTGQRQFLDDAGHELKTPLTVLRGHLELLDTGSPEEVAETRVLLLDEVDRMARLVGDLILLAKSDRPDFVTLEPVDLAGLTEDLVAKARGLGDREWVLDGAAAGTLQADPQRLTQAVLQLADNAVKHTAPGDTVAIGSSYDGSRVRLWVRDTGPGVPPEQRDGIFERFGRGPVPEGDEGFGLGLSIVSAIAAAHGGRVLVEDAEPHGARFVLTLPATLTSTEEHPWPAS